MSLRINGRVIVLTPGIQARARALNKMGPLLKVMAREVHQQLKTHFRTNERTKPNKKGWKRAHFWADIAQSVQQPTLQGETRAEVVIDDPRLPQKIHGGPIEPVNKKALTIPLIEEAYNRRAGQIEDLFFIPRKGGRGGNRVGFLARKEEGGGEGALQLVYALYSRVNQDPDPDAMPEESVLESAMARRAEAYLKRQEGRAAFGGEVRG